MFNPRNINRPSLYLLASFSSLIMILALLYVSNSNLAIIQSNLDINNSRLVASVDGASLTSDPSLVAYWKFDGEDGLNIKDYSNAKNDFKFTQAGFVPGKVRQAVDLMKTFGNIPHSESLSIDKEITIGLWVYTRAFINIPRAIFIKQEPGKPLETINYGLYLGTPKDKDIVFYGGTDSSHWGAISGKVSIQSGQWQHVLLTYKSDEGGKLYMNGILASDYYEYNFKGLLSKNQGAIKIGGNGTDVLIDELMIFNRALDANEVKSLVLGDEEKILISSEPNKSVSVGTKITFTLSTVCSSSCDGISFALENAPEGAFIEASTGKFEWTPTTSQSGDYKITFKATKGSLSASTNVDFKINPLPTTSGDCRNDSSHKCLDFGSNKESESGSSFNAGLMTEMLTEGDVNYRSILPGKNLEISIPSFSTNSYGGIADSLFLEVRYKDTEKIDDPKTDSVKVYSLTGLSSNNPLVIKRGSIWVANIGDKGDGQWKTASYFFQAGPTPLIRDDGGKFKFSIHNTKLNNISIDYISLKAVPKSEANSYLENKRKANGFVLTPIPEKLSSSNNLENKNLVVFFRDYMRPIFEWSKPSESEIGKTVKGLGFLGELETLNIGLYSDIGISGLSFDISNLINSNGDVIVPESRFFEIKYGNHRLGTANRMEYNYLPDYLEAVSSLSIGSKSSKRIVARVRIPESAKGGIYTGSVNVKKDGSVMSSVPVNLKVVPLVLEKSKTDASIFHDPYSTPYALNFDESLKIYRDAGVIPSIIVFAGDLKFLDKTSAKYDVSRFEKKIDELIAGKVLSNDGSMISILFNPWSSIYTDMLGTINGKPVGAVDAKYLGLDTTDLYDRLSHPDYIRAFKNVLSSINEIATSRGLKFIYFFVDEPVGHIDRLIVGDRLHTYARELGLKTWTTGASQIPTKINQGGYTGAVSEFQPLINLTDFDITIADGTVGAYTTLTSFLKFPVYNRFYLGVYSFAKNWKFISVYALGSNAQDPYDDFDEKPGSGYENSAPDYLLGYTSFDGTWLPAMSYEGMREGVRDNKYLSTLEKLINTSEDGVATKEAKIYLDSIKNRVGSLGIYKDFLWKIRPHGFYDLILGAVSQNGEDDFEYFSDMREQIANHIIKIKNINISTYIQPTPTPTPYLPPGTTPTPTPYLPPGRTPPVNNPTPTPSFGSNYQQPTSTRRPTSPYIPTTGTKPDPKNYPTLLAPTTTIDTTLPEIPSWLDIIIEFIKDTAIRVKMGAVRTIDEVRGLVGGE